MPYVSPFAPKAPAVQHMGQPLGQPDGSPEERPSFVKDIFMAPARGVEGLLKSTYNLVDSFGEKLGGDFLPDWDKRFLGRSQTMAGGILEGAVQFGIGWGTTGLALKAVSGLAGIGRGAAAVNTVGQLSRSQKALQLGKAAAKGGVVDFWAFEGDEGRLADLLAQYPAFADSKVMGPVLEFLQSDESDGEIEGRMKNVLEGAGIGAGVDLIVSASKVLRATAKNSPDRLRLADDLENKQKQIDEKITWEDLQKTMEETSGFAEGKPIEFGGKLYYPDPGKAAGSILEDTPGVPTEGNPKVSINGNPRTLSEGASTNIRKTIDTSSLVGKLRAAGPEATQAVDEEIRKFADRAAEPLLKYFREGGKGGRIQDILEEFDSKLLDEVTTSDDLLYIANKLSEYVGDSLKEVVAGSKEGLTDFFEKYYKEVVSKEYKDFAENLGGTGRIRYEDVLKELSEANTQGFEAIARQEAMRGIIMNRAERFTNLAKEAMVRQAQGADVEDLLQEIAGVMEQGMDGIRLVNEAGYQRGMGLALFKNNPADFKVYNIKAIRHSQDAEDYFGGLKAAMTDKDRLWDVIEKAAKLDPKDHRAMNRLFQGLTESNGARKYDTWKAWYKNNLLMNPATTVMATASTILRAHIGSFERYLGAKFNQAVAWNRKNPAAVQAYKAQAEGAVREFRAFWGAIGDGLHHAKVAWQNEGRGQFFDRAYNKLEGTEQEIADMLEGINQGRLDAKGFLKKWKDGTLDVIMPFQTIPGRMLGAIDEGMKVMSYNSLMKSQAFSRGRAMGLSKEAAEEYAEDMFQKSTIAGSRMVSEKAYAEMARQAAEDRIAKKYGGEIPAEAGREVAEEAERIFVEINPKVQNALKRKQMELLVKAGRKDHKELKEFVSSQAYRDTDWLFQASRQAEETALRNVFQEDLSRTGFGGAVRYLQRWSQEDTLGGAFISTALPFMKTPYNVVKYSVDTLGGPFKAVNLAVSKRSRQKFMDLIEKGANGTPQQQAEALEAVGRIGFGTMLTFVGASLGASGVITGMRPKDPGEAAVWDSLGIQEYSFKVGDSYVSYSRIEPLATVFGLFADFADRGNLTREEQAGLFTQMSVALASNMTEKTFLTSVSTVLEAALSGEERKLDRAINSVIAPVFANPGVAALNRNFTDDGTIRETLTLFDAVQGRTPGAAITVDPRRNILGETVQRTHPATSGAGSMFGMLNPLYLSKRKSDKVMEELLSLQKVPSAPSPRVGPLDLREYPSSTGETSAFDQRNELIGTIEINGKNLRTRLEELFKSDRYKKFSGLGPIEGELDDPRYLMIQQVLRMYRSRANLELQRVNPQIGELIRESRGLQSQINRGLLSTVDANNILFQ